MHAVRFASAFHPSRCRYAPGFHCRQRRERFSVAWIRLRHCGDIRSVGLRASSSSRRQGVTLGAADDRPDSISHKMALRCLQWYTLRWRIEEWHRILKTGCRIESLQHRSADKLARAIAIDAVIAWRVMLLTLLGRDAPEMPCELIFSPWECRLLEKLQPVVAPETMNGQKQT